MTYPLFKRIGSQAVPELIHSMYTDLATPYNISSNAAKIKREEASRHADIDVNELLSSPSYALLMSRCTRLPLLDLGGLWLLYCILET